MNEDPTDYQWVETGWLTSLWRFVYMAKLKLIYPSNWLPPAPRAHDKFLMEHFLNKKLNKRDLIALNQCRIYMQVITLSDTTSAMVYTSYQRQNWANQFQGGKAI
jgi:hypothetical protein